MSNRRKGMVSIPVPLHDMEDGVIMLPENMNKQQWDYAKKIASFLLENYRPDFSNAPEPEDDSENEEDDSDQGLDY